ncbi:hypothetical protein MCOR21_008295 [Pyricularia oryzae]|nr:hypothetical protein MCOR01_003599 [Pyricularia oryzae]KAI6311592.1 hypothetical protein MCOR34_005937 [Pyricularia oryzae]KAI6423248.1 hypothetical protein MCOR21_008295 [Pyricularia oryzae]KAI6491315.1 hypothetical protein MCOR11_007172 [Pyricularia oryzae]KAI6509347.1 hypothetical protein MCOR13_001707 [Pyricularia oryzae]
MRASITYMSFLWLVPGTTAGIIPSYLLPPIIGDLMNEDKSQAGAPQTPELLPGSPYCVQAYEVNAGDTCASIAKQHGLFKEQVQIWSPVAKHEGCDSLPVGSRICVAVANEPEPLRWTPEKQAAANEAALKKLAEEEKKRKEDEEKARKKKQDEEREKKEEEERKKKEEEERKKKEEEEEKKKAEEFEKRKIPMVRNGKVVYPEPEGGKYPFVYFGRGSVPGRREEWSYAMYFMDRPNDYRLSHIAEYDDRCTFFTLEVIKEPMGEVFTPDKWTDRAMVWP